MTQANNVGQLTPQVNSSGVLQVAGGGTGLSAVGTSGYVLASNGSANVYVSAVGYSGYSGYSGTNGSNGTSGYSGYSGSNGSNGATGTSGYSGATGSNGSAGTSGYSGYSGTGASTSANGVGSYAFCGKNGQGYIASTVVFGTNYGGGTGSNLLALNLLSDSGGGLTANTYQGSISGTWKWLSADFSGSSTNTYGIAVRVA